VRRRLTALAFCVFWLAVLCGALVLIGLLGCRLRPKPYDGPGVTVEIVDD
jgi:hypothetical protein